MDEPRYAIEPPDRTRVADWSYDQLRLMILNDELSPGTKLSVPALAVHLAVSRSPVREAVLRLIQEGLAEEVPHKGAAVSKISREDLVAVYEVREALDSIAAKLAAQKVTPQLIEDLEANLVRHENVILVGGDLSEHMSVDLQFHQFIRSAADNRWLSNYLSQIQGQIQLAMVTTSVTAGMRAALDEHHRIFEAIKAGDPVAAELAARGHVHRLRNALRLQPAKSRG